jgi:hypothetical protein
VHDEQSFLQFVRDLQRDCQSASPSDEALHDGARWENGTIEAFLDAAHAWATESSFGRTQGLADAASPWQRFATFLYAGKIYE